MNKTSKYLAALSIAALSATLAHADGELGGIMCGEARHAHGAQGLHGAVVPFGLRHALEFQRDAEILDHGVPGKQRALLEHKSDLVGVWRAVDLAAAVKTAVINKRAGGTGLISGRKAFQRPMAEGVQLLNAIQDVYLDPAITVA